MSKVDIKKLMLAKRKSFDKDKKRRYDAIIKDQAMFFTEDATTIGIYAATPDEVDTYAIMEDLIWDSKKRIVVPKVEGDSLKFYQITSFKQFEPGAYGIMEPTVTTPVELSEIDLMFVPLVAFDASLHRIGYGKGYYDRTLAHCSAKKIGLAFSFQEVNDIMSTEHDVPCDIIITEKAIITS